MNIPAAPDRGTVAATCRPRYGTGNPEAVANPYWEWAIRAEMDPYTARQAFKLPSSASVHRRHGARHAYRDDENGPVWTFARFGMSETDLAGGRRLCIAGEHEDWYDPDFCIYNDVIIFGPDDAIAIYAYPLDVFPPTDFHSATQVAGSLFLIGSVGYVDLRRPGTTPVHALDLETMAISRIATSGPEPGWIGHHDAEYIASDNAIVVSGGRVCLGEGEHQGFVSLEGHHALSLETMTWSRIG